MKSENVMTGFSLGTQAPTERVRKALSQLEEFASAGSKAADEVADLLESAVAAMKERPVPAAMPVLGRGHWEFFGAGSDDDAAPNLTRLQSRAKLQDLANQSVAGDVAAAALLGVDRSRISQRIGERTLYAFTTGRRGGSGPLFFPAWQFVGNGTLPGLGKVLDVLPSHLHPLVVHHWFTTSNAELRLRGSDPLSPRDWLVTGGPVATVVALAAQE